MVVLREGCTNGAGGEAEGHPDTLSACPGCTVSGTQSGGWHKSLVGEFGGGRGSGGDFGAAHNDLPKATPAGGEAGARG